MSQVFVPMPLQLTPEMMRAVRDNQLTACQDMEEWHTRLGWLICAWDVLIEARPRPPVEEPTP
jgi:hypothetical protein